MIRSLRSITVALLAVLTLIATPLMASANDTQPEMIRTINTGGTGVITVEPDAARFSIGLEARNENLKPAQDEVTAESQKITEAILAAGVEEKDIVTLGYEVEPVEKRDRNGNFVEIESYVVRLAITITVRDLEIVGTLLDETVTLGADYVSSISFFVSDPDPYIQQARQAAIADARTKAEDYAAGSDATITGLYTLYESSSPSPSPQEAGATDRSAPAAMDASMEAEANPVSVSAGSTTITVRVETTWTIEPNGTIEPAATPAN